MSSYRAVLFFTITLSACMLKAQEQLGLRIENYSGINAVGLNPAANIGSPLNWDLQLAGAGAFLENNYAFLPNQSALSLIGNFGQIGSENLPLNYTNREGRYSGYANAQILGPAFMLNLEDQSFGVFSKFRAVGGARRIPTELGWNNLQSLSDRSTLDLNRFQAAAMSWGELGFNYARRIDDQLSVGGNVKILRGFDGLGIKNHATTRLASEGDGIVSVDQFHYTIAMASGGMISENPTMNGQGWGLGVDLGATYTIPDGDGYKWKFGAALLDLGAINFGENARYNSMTARDTFQLTSSELDQISGIIPTIDFFNEKVLARPHSSVQKENFALWLPAALSLQADLALTQNFYVNATMIRRFPTPGIGVKRANVLALTPRFESKWFGLSAPVTLYNDQDLRLGLAARMGPLTIGSDHLLGLFQPQDFSGADVYAALKINPFEIQSNRSRSRSGISIGGPRGFRPKGRRRSRGGGEPKCYKPKSRYKTRWR